MSVLRYVCIIHFFSVMTNELCACLNVLNSNNAWLISCTVNVIYCAHDLCTQNIYICHLCDSIWTFAAQCN